MVDQETNNERKDNEDVLCNICGNVLDACMCVCPYCGVRDKCECCLLDAATGG